MPDTPFPHLHFKAYGELKTKFPQSRRPVPEEVRRINQNPKLHAQTIRGILEGLEKNYKDNENYRKNGGLPVIGSGVGFLLRVKEGADVDAIAHALNLELVAEAEGGFMLVATEDVSFQKLKAVLDLFSAGQGGGTAASVIETFSKPDDKSRLERILTAEVLQLWPFDLNKEYTFDVSIQTAASLRKVDFRLYRKRGEADEIFAARKREYRNELYAKASDIWSDHADKRFDELASLVRHYGGKLLSGFASAPDVETENGVRFADCITVRVQMTGQGFQDVVYSLPHIFEVACPDEGAMPVGEAPTGAQGKPDVEAPDATAPAVCVIDSGIQQAHLWLQPAIDAVSSRCFIPDLDFDAVGDEVATSGHGTRVAGAVLYPLAIPVAGKVKPIAWIQNARVLDSKNCIPKNLPPARYLTEVVKHFIKAAKPPKIFNHSIAGNFSCPLGRMTAWSAKIDELSDDNDILFIQAAGNLEFNGKIAVNPGVVDHRNAGRKYPNFLLEPSSRIANPAQSLQALTVGAIQGAAFHDGDLKSFGADPHHPASYSRTGFGMWDAVKPEVVEVGGDRCHEVSRVGQCIPRAETATHLLCATIHQTEAHSKDGCGTSFAAPRVAHIAAALQLLFPHASPLLYRALIVQSASWPKWAQSTENKDEVLRYIGFGKPDLDKATRNSEHRVSLITDKAVIIRNGDLHLYAIKIPNQIRILSTETKILVEVTLSYSSAPRRTRQSRYGYLRTRLDWRSSGLGEPLEDYRDRELRTAKKIRKYPQLPWTLHFRDNLGEATETNRDRGTVQKDWAICEPHNLSADFAIAVRSHPGWDHRKEEGKARYCLVVSFEAIGTQVPIYAQVKAAQIETEAEIHTEIEI